MRCLYWGKRFSGVPSFLFLLLLTKKFFKKFKMVKTSLSVVIPTFNEERFIEKCLQSVSWADEVIVVDGGSQDRTLEIIKRYQVKVISTDNAPAETQRLKGLQAIRN